MGNHLIYINRRSSRATTPSLLFEIGIGKTHQRPPAATMCHGTIIMPASFLRDTSPKYSTRSSDDQALSCPFAAGCKRAVRAGAAYGYSAGAKCLLARRLALVPPVSQQRQRGSGLPAAEPREAEHAVQEGVREPRHVRGVSVP